MHYHTMEEMYSDNNIIIEKCSKCKFKLQSPLYKITPRYIKAHIADTMSYLHPDFKKVYGIKQYRKVVDIYKKRKKQEEAELELEKVLKQAREEFVHNQLLNQNNIICV